MQALALLFALGCMVTTGCSVRSMAINELGDALSKGGSAFASDDDPELVKATAPFSMKLLESLLAESPRYRGLLLVYASGFTQCAYAFVQQEADELEEQDFDAASIFAPEPGTFNCVLATTACKINLDRTIYDVLHYKETIRLLYEF